MSSSVIKIPRRPEILLVRASGEEIRFRFRLCEMTRQIVTSCVLWSDELEKDVERIFASDSVDGLMQQIRRFFNRLDG